MSRSLGGASEEEEEEEPVYNLGDIRDLAEVAERGAGNVAADLVGRGGGSQLVRCSAFFRWSSACFRAASHPRAAALVSTR